MKSGCRLNKEFRNGDFTSNKKAKNVNRFLSGGYTTATTLNNRVNKEFEDFWYSK